MGFDSSSDDLAFATPRSWEMVSNLLNCVSDDIDDMFSLISGIVGCVMTIVFLMVVGYIIKIKRKKGNIVNEQN